MKTQADVALEIIATGTLPLDSRAVGLTFEDGSSIVKSPIVGWFIGCGDPDECRHPAVKSHTLTDGSVVYDCPLCSEPFILRDGRFELASA